MSVLTVGLGFAGVSAQDTPMTQEMQELRLVPGSTCSFEVRYAVSELSPSELEARMTVTSNRDESAPLQVVYWFEEDGNSNVGMDLEYVNNAVIVTKGDADRGVPTRLKTSRPYSQGQRAEIMSSVRAVARSSASSDGMGANGTEGSRDEEGGSALEAPAFGASMSLGLRNVNVNGIRCERKGRSSGVSMEYGKCMNAISFFTSFNGRPPPTGGATDECAMEFCCGEIPATVEQPAEVAPENIGTVIGGGVDGMALSEESNGDTAQVPGNPMDPSGSLDGQQGSVGSLTGPSGAASQEASNGSPNELSGAPQGGSSGVLIGVVAGVAAVLVGISVVSFMVIRRRRRQRVGHDGAGDGDTDSQMSTPRKQLSLKSTASGFCTLPNRVSIAASTVGVNTHHLATQSSLSTQASLHSQHSGLPTPIDHLPDDLPEDVILHEKLGAGAFGTVFKGEWGGHTVAVKVLQTAYASDSREMDSFRQEIAVLSGLRHPNIVAFLAACTIPPDICIVEELAEGGSLHTKLHGTSGSEDRCRPLPPNEVVRLAIDVAQAMVYLHPNIVHRDLKSQNVLLDAEGRAKVCDFGIAKFKDRTFVSTVNGQAGTPAYMAPELFDGMNATEKVDVYSFAILLWECITGKVPWGHVPSPMQIIYYVGVLNQRPALPTDDRVPRDLVELIEDCWLIDPKKRPGFQEVLRRLRAMQSDGGNVSEGAEVSKTSQKPVESEMITRSSSGAAEMSEAPVLPSNLPSERLSAPEASCEDTPDATSQPRSEDIVGSLEAKSNPKTHEEAPRRVTIVARATTRGDPVGTPGQVSSVRSFSINL